MLDERFVFAGVIISLVGGLIYVVHTLQGKTKPNRVTWFMWALAPMIAFAAEIGDGVGTQAWMTFIVGFNPLLVFIASFASRKAVWKLTSFDFTCGALSMLGLLLWIITMQNDVAIIFAILADGIAAVPTLKKSYYHPSSESWVGYIGGSVGGILTLLTIDHWTFARYGFPLYIALVCTALVIMIRFRVGERLLAREVA